MDLFDEILRDTADYISWKLEEGDTTAEVDRSVLLALAEGADVPRKAPVLETVREDVPVAPVPAPSEQPVVADQQLPAAGVVAGMEAAPVAVSSSDPAVGQSLAEIAAVVSSCTLCPLHAGRTNTVPGQGCESPDILFVGEAPGADEDAQGVPFVGRAGKLLTKMIEAMGYTRETVFIANVNKCRPPNNRKPLREEMDACLPYLRQQVAVLRPKVIVALGSTAVEGLVPESASQRISDLRGNWLSFEGIPVMPTYHPAYLLRSPTMKKPVWEDLQAVLRRLGRPIPKHSKS